MDHHSSSNSASSNSLYITPSNSPTHQSLTHSIDCTSLDLSFSFNDSQFYQNQHLLPTQTHSPLSTSSTIRANQEPPPSTATQSNAPPMNLNQKNCLRLNSSFHQLSLHGSSFQDERNASIELIGKYLHDLEEDRRQVNSLCTYLLNQSEKIGSKLDVINNLLIDLKIEKKDAQTQTALLQENGNDQNRKESVSRNQSSSNQSLVQKAHESMDFTFNSPSIMNSTLLMNSSSLRNAHYNFRMQNGFPNYQNQNGQVATISIKLTPGIKKKLDRLPALVKGYLIRRLLRSEKVQQNIDVIKETLKLLKGFQVDVTDITEQDVDFHGRLIDQLQNSRRKFYDIFFNYPKKMQMEIIAQSRNLLLEKQFRSNSSFSTTSSATKMKTRKSTSLLPKSFNSPIRPSPCSKLPKSTARTLTVREPMKRQIENTKVTESYTYQKVSRTNQSAANKSRNTSLIGPKSKILKK